MCSIIIVRIILFKNHFTTKLLFNQVQFHSSTFLYSIWPLIYSMHITKFIYKMNVFYPTGLVPNVLPLYLILFQR